MSTMVHVSDSVELSRRSHRTNDPGRVRTDWACHRAQPKRLIVRVRGVEGEKVGIRWDGICFQDGAPWCLCGNAFSGPGSRTSRPMESAKSKSRRLTCCTPWHWLCGEQMGQVHVHLSTEVHVPRRQREVVWRALLRLRKPPATTLTARSRIESTLLFMHP
jgi:hypothetical protein